MPEYRSSIFFESNLWPVGESFHDSKFLLKITDPAALEKLKKDPQFFIYNFSPLQEEIYKRCALHCAFADEGDFPWGIPAGSHIGEKVICLCAKTECKRFSKCRPGFIPEEPSEVPVQPVETQSAEIFETYPPIAKPVYEKDDLKNQEDFPLPHYSDTESDVLPECPEEERDGAAISENLSENATEEESEDTGAPFPAEELLNARDISGFQEKRPDEIEPAASEKTPEAHPCEQIESSRPVQENVAGCESFTDFIPVEQEYVITLPPGARVLVNSPPGTGKTHALIERIRHLVEDEEIPPEEILVLTFSRAAAAVIRERIGNIVSKSRDLADLEAGTFDSFAFSLLNLYRNERPDLCPSAGLDYDEGIRAATKLIQAFVDEPVLAGCRHVVIDEIQDLSGVRATLVMALLASRPAECGFTLLGDACQSIYDWRKDGEANGLFSWDLYQWLMSPRPGITSYVSFTVNHREKGNLPDTGPYRDAILSGNRTETDACLSTLLDQIQSPFPRMEVKLISDIIQSFPQKETLGILSRTNGQALAISSMLSAWDIGHTLLWKRDEHVLANWIAGIFMDLDAETIHRDDFVSSYMELYGKSDDEALAHACWNALAGEARAPSREIRDLLADIAGNRNPLLWRHAGMSAHGIEVGNVFRAKGREYDNVLLVDELFETKKDSSSLNDRVRYVALTRARKRIIRISAPEEGSRMEKDNGCQMERCFKMGGARANGRGFSPRYISHFEIGVAGDFDPSSFAQNRSAQESIAELVSPGMEITLFKLSKPEEYGQSGYPVYIVCIGSDGEYVDLGRTEKSFGESLSRSLRIIYTHKIIEYRHFPDVMRGIYVTSTVSHISVWNSNLAGAKQFGDMALWRGISCHGLAATEKISY